MTSGMSNTDPAAGPVISPHMRGRPRAALGEALNGRNAEAVHPRGDAKPAARRAGACLSIGRLSHYALLADSWGSGHVLARSAPG